MTANLTRATLYLRILCAVALVSLAFAHKPPQVLAAIIETTALQLPDGSYADLCIGERGTSIPGVPAGKCEACLLGGQTVLPPPSDCSWLIASFASLENRPVSDKAVPVASPVAQPRSRGPPAFS